MSIKLRDAEIIDAEMIYQWRNDEKVRKNSFNEDIIPYEQHLRWFEQALKNPDRYIFIILLEAESVGCIRFDVCNETAQVSIYLAPGKHGQGLGTQGLLEGLKMLQRKRPSVKIVKADIFPDNDASQKAFTKAGFNLSHYVYTFNFL